MILQVNPFPECESEAQAIILMSFMFASILILIFLMLSMLYLYKKYKEKFELIVSVFLFSLIIGIDSLSYTIPFTPYIQLFFLLFQTIFFISFSIDYYNRKMR